MQGASIIQGGRGQNGRDWITLHNCFDSMFVFDIFSSSALIAFLLCIVGIRTCNGLL